MRIFLFSSTKSKKNLKSLEKIEEHTRECLCDLGFQDKDMEFFVERSCESAMRNLSTSREYDIHIISINNDGCYSNGLADFCSLNLKNKNQIILLLEDSLSHTNKNRQLVFLPKERKIHIRHRDIINKSLLSKVLKTMINKPDIYISYGNDDNKETFNLIRTIENKIEKSIPYINVKYDRKSLNIGDSIIQFMKNLSSSSRVILIVNEKYLKSQYGMKELGDIMRLAESERASLKDRIFPLIMNDATCIYSLDLIQEIKEYWNDQLSQKIIKRSKDEMQEIIDVIDLIPSLIGDLYSLTISAQEEEDFIDLLWTIHKKTGDAGYLAPYEDAKEMKKYL